MTTPPGEQPDRTQSSATGWPSDEPLPRPPVPAAPSMPPMPPVPPAEPVTEPVAAPPPAAEPVVEPAVEPAVEPVVEPAVEPVVEPAVEPVVEPAVAAVAPARRSRLITVPVLALLIMTVLMAVATGWIWLQVHQHDQAESARRAGLEASRDAARVLFSYDYRTLDKDFAAGRALTTGAFAKQYADTTSKVVSDVAKQKQAVVKADVVNAGVVRASGDQVVTVVFVNQVTTSTLLTAPKVDLSRVRMTLQHVGDRWLVSKVDAL